MRLKCGAYLQAIPRGFGD